jgi:ferredoxin-NADP reductase
MPYQYYPCKVIKIEEVTDCIRTYSIEFPEDFHLEFKAGQFAMFDLPIESKVTNRSYSIASAPDGSRVLEFLIVLNPQGLGTPHLFDNVKEGDTIMCSKPIGKFGLPEIIDKDICFVCTGTGVAPFRSMIQDIYNKAKPHKKLTLIYGARKVCDLAYKNEFDRLAAIHPEFTFIPVLSRESKENWNGHLGYVHQIYQNLYPKADETLFYLCGFGNMLREARENLSLLGFEKSQIKFESYD